MLAQVFQSGQYIDPGSGRPQPALTQPATQFCFPLPVHARPPWTLSRLVRGQCPGSFRREVLVTCLPAVPVLGPPGTSVPHGHVGASLLGQRGEVALGGGTGDAEI